jgi:hypothetical protein
MARKYLAAIAGRNRFSHRYGVELAEAVLALTAAAAAPPAAAPSTELETLPSRPGLARARAPRPPPLELEGEQLGAVASADARRR